MSDWKPPIRPVEIMFMDQPANRTWRIKQRPDCRFGLFLDVHGDIGKPISYGFGVFDSEKDAFVETLRLHRNPSRIRLLRD